MAGTLGAGGALLLMKGVFPMRLGWRFLFGPLWALCVAGAVLIVCLAAGWYSWQAFVLAGVIGLVAGVPAGVWNARKVRRDDPDWDGSRV